MPGREPETAARYVNCVTFDPTAQHRRTIWADERAERLDGVNDRAHIAQDKTDIRTERADIAQDYSWQSLQQDQRISRNGVAMKGARPWEGADAQIRSRLG